MLWSEIITWDPSLTLQKGKVDEEGILGITTPDYPKKNHFVLIKEKKFVERMIVHSPSTLQKLGLVVQESFWQKNHARPEWATLWENVQWLAVVKDVATSLWKISEPFYLLKKGEFDWNRDGRESGKVSIDPSATIAPGVFIGEGVTILKNVQIGAGSVIMAGTSLDEGTTLFPRVTLYPWVKVGKKCRLHSGAVIGSDGFGYSFSNGEHHKIWHMGGVEIGDEVEIGANSCVDMGTFSPTTIGSGSKIDNFVQIAHNCHVGKGVILCGHAGLSGSCHIGDFSVFGGHSGCGPDITLGMGCQVAGGALVGCDWPPQSVLGGHPARPLNEWMRGLAYLRKESLKPSQKKSSSKESE